MRAVALNRLRQPVRADDAAPCRSAWRWASSALTRASATLTGFCAGLEKLVGQTTMRTVTDYSFGVIPMFLLMGAFVSVPPASAANCFVPPTTFVGHWKGGLGIAHYRRLPAASPRSSGSSVATPAATFFRPVAYPEMRRFGYPQSFCHRRDRGRRHARRECCRRRRCFAGLRASSPQQDIGKLFHRPGHRARTARDRDAHDHHRHHRWSPPWPQFLPPAGPPASWA